MVLENDILPGLQSHQYSEYLIYKRVSFQEDVHMMDLLINLSKDLYTFDTNLQCKA